MNEIKKPEGILLIDKPKDWTSFDVVAKARGLMSQELRRIYEQKVKIKVGHTGTLDPAATGLLVLAYGKMTKSIEGLMKVSKTYLVEARFGFSSTTGDSEGEITNHSTTDEEVTEAELREALRSFEGEQLQTPPAFSAIKINGQRAYDLARKGKDVKLEPRPITIHDIQLTQFNYPDFNFSCTVSSGTYIRSLVEDIAAKLGSKAYMTNLRRTQVGDYEIKNSLSIEQLPDAINRLVQQAQDHQTEQ